MPQPRPISDALARQATPMLVRAGCCRCGAGLRNVWVVRGFGVAVLCGECVRSVAREQLRYQRTRVHPDTHELDHAG